MKENRSVVGNGEKVADGWQVLIVDDDAACLAEYVELIESLGYACLSAADAPRALQMISANPSIGLVISDVKMPDMDGITFFEELADRFMSHRPLVTIAITADPSMETAVSAMRSNATDFLEKPVSLVGLSTTLRRARSRWMAIAQQRAGLSLSDSGSREEREGSGRIFDKPSPTHEDLKNLAVMLLKTRQFRSKFFAPDITTGPAWDILVDLAAAGLQGKSVVTSSACAATEAPFSTALRHVNHLVASGVIRRKVDESDRRRSLLELEPDALELMTQYLSQTWSSLAAHAP